MKTDENADQVNEPAASFRRIIFDKSFNEQEEANYRFWLGLTPEERLAHATSIIRKVYADPDSGTTSSKRIYFESE